MYHHQIPLSFPRLCIGWPAICVDRACSCPNYSVDEAEFMLVGSFSAPLRVILGIWFILLYSRSFCPQSLRNIILKHRARNAASWQLTEEKIRPRKVRPMQAILHTLVRACFRSVLHSFWVFGHQSIGSLLLALIQSSLSHRLPPPPRTPQFAGGRFRSPAAVMGGQALIGPPLIDPCLSH